MADLQTKKLNYFIMTELFSELTLSFFLKTLTKRVLNLQIKGQLKDRILESEDLVQERVSVLEWG